MTHGKVLPQWRHRGIGGALQRWAERHLRELVAQQPAAGPRVFRSFAADAGTGVMALLEQNGYRAIRYGLEMSRSFAEPIPDLLLPEGVEVRSVTPDQY